MVPGRTPGLTLSGANSGAKSTPLVGAPCCCQRGVLREDVLSRAYVKSLNDGRRRISPAMQAMLSFAT
jgi:hypothetical protein